jgi:hypothetical protein
MVTYILIFMGGVFIATAVVLLFKFYFTNRRRMTSMTDGRVIRSEERVVIEKDLRKTMTEIVASYQLRGKEYEVRRVIEGAKAKVFPPGRVVRVRYNPGEPDMSEVAI